MHWTHESACRVLSDTQKDRFVQEGFVKLENTFSRKTGAEARAILWRATRFDPEDKTTWTQPVVRLGDFPQEPFRWAVNTPLLLAAFDELVGVGRWVPRESLAGFPIRIPHADYSEWRVNLRSKGRALLMLFLFSDVGEEEAPTRIRAGSHLRVPELLAPAGEDGLSAIEIGIAAARATRGMKETTETGAAGTVYLCHPFLVHAAQPHRGARPRFLAQPPLFPRLPFELQRRDGQHSRFTRSG